ncbi:MAG: aminotransferase class IV [Chitinophagaceae bacterium]|nr:aminotransferase class IV [Chitinophagaceae bacterium]MCA6453429.1 aminotransferase class IV [Chitinophagaceae bacterium]MCA6455196.1 aminotransferase class IV [Chitinophagaceae bacterium]MCA6459582.1 aminotransferase class IV [Chitinophagaceae bacterium]MCA6464449.1 aminotransferase class IV [Chitinophagaceae bacterium]
MQPIFEPMVAGNFLFYNGRISKAGKPLISPDNRSFRYGDGFFETLKLLNGKIILADHHFERLFASLDLLHFQKPTYFTPEYLYEHISLLAKKNYHHKMARVRVTIFRGDGGLYDVENHFPHHLIQTWQLNPANNHLNENGLVIGIYPDAKKVCDHFSAVKSNNYLGYAMGALWAKQQKYNDVILLNPYGRVADATIANVFVVKDGMVKTPALTEGPINGIMRRYLLEMMRKENIPVEEGMLTLEELEQASELFLTNSIYGIRWVRQMGKSGYTHQLTSHLYKNFILPLQAEKSAVVHKQSVGQ